MTAPGPDFSCSIPEPAALGMLILPNAISPTVPPRGAKSEAMNADGFILVRNRGFALSGNHVRSKEITGSHPAGAKVGIFEPAPCCAGAPGSRLVATAITGYVIRYLASSSNRSARKSGKVG
jgi:hypothetical protein